MVELLKDTGGIVAPLNRLAGRETMRQVTATEVKARWGELLREAEAGETIAITRRGKVVAHLSPAGALDVGDGASEASAKEEPAWEEAGEESPDEKRLPTTWHEWAQMVRERRARLEGVTVSTEEILSWIREGRR